MKRALSAIAVLSSLTVASEGYAQSDVTSGLNLLIQIFGPIRSAYHTIVVDPAARAQSLSRLRILSAQLEILALHKEEFTQGVIRDRRGDRTSARELEESIWQVRRALAKVFEPLPDNLKVRGGEIQGRLEVELRGKLANLHEIGDTLKLATPSEITIRTESDAMLKTISQIRSDVNQLIQEITARN